MSSLFASCGSVWLSVQEASCFDRSFGSIEFIIDLKSSNFSALILTPAFVNPVYLSDLTNSLIVRPACPPKSSIHMMIFVSLFFWISPISFSIIYLSLFCL